MDKEIIGFTVEGSRSLGVEKRRGSDVTSSLTSCLPEKRSQTSGDYPSPKLFLKWDKPWLSCDIRVNHPRTPNMPNEFVFNGI